MKKIITIIISISLIISLICCGIGSYKNYYRELDNNIYIPIVKEENGINYSCKLTKSNYDKKKKQVDVNITITNTDTKDIIYKKTNTYDASVFENIKDCSGINLKLEYIKKEKNNKYYLLSFLDSVSATRKVIYANGSEYTVIFDFSNSVANDYALVGTKDKVNNYDIYDDNLEVIECTGNGEQAKKNIYAFSNKTYLISNIDTEYETIGGVGCKNFNNDLDNDLFVEEIGEKAKSYYNDYNMKDIDEFFKKIECDNDNCEVNYKNIAFNIKEKDDGYNLYINGINRKIFLAEKKFYVFILRDKFIMIYDNNGNYYLLNSSGKIITRFSDYGVANSKYINIFMSSDKFYIESNTLFVDKEFDGCLDENVNAIAYSVDLYKLKSDGSLEFVKQFKKKTINDVVKEKYNKSCEEIRQIGLDTFANIVNSNNE